MNRKRICFIILTLFICNAVPALGATTNSDEKTVVSFENIKDIMLHNNIQLQIAENNYKKTKQSYEDLEDEIDDLNDELDNLSKPTDDGTEDYEEQLQAYKTKYNSIKDTLETKEKEEEIYKQYTLKNAKITYETTVQKKIYEAQKAYINYLNNLDNIALNEQEAEADTKDVNLAKNKYEYGFMSKSEYENTILEKNAKTNDYNSYKKETEESLQNLYYILGISLDDDVTIQSDIDDLFSIIEEINYDEDLNTMLSNNYDIKSKELELKKIDIEEDYAEDDDDYQYDEENGELNVEAQTIQSQLDFKSAYNTLINSYNSFKTSYDKVSKSKKTYETEKEQNSLGFISDNTLEKDKRVLEESIASLVNARNTVYLNYINYEQMKEGY